MHDVVIVGGGLAGSALATHLARAGRRVLVLERRTTPARKACGEGLFERGIAELRSLGVLDALARDSQPLDGVRFHAGAYVAAARSPARGTRRGPLEAQLLSVARHAGAEIRQGLVVRRLAVRDGRAGGVVTDAGIIEARIVVGADGLNSLVRRRAGLESPHHGARFGVTAHIRPPDEAPPWVEVFFERDHELYLTPVGDGVVNAALLTRREGMARFAGDIAGAFERLLQVNPATTGAQFVDVPLAAGPFAAGCRRAYRANVVLVGDAAGFFDGITGEGMSAALAGARLCAAAIDAQLAGDVRAFARYDHQRRGLVRNSNMLGRVSVALGSRSWLASVVVRNLSRRPATFERLVRVNSGAAPFHSLRPGDLSALLFGL